ncbi:MAG TPA: calcium-binding protein [Anaerovoracaceae bacterium]|nr:calcium-binding protein [Anaerovoracaceae bacterium]
MLQIIRSEYGREINVFEFDYLGGHAKLEGVILNAAVKVFENGLYIGSVLKSGHAYLKWDEIIDIVYLYGKRETIVIKYSKGKVLLEKAKQEVNMEGLLNSVMETAPDITVIRKACCQNDLYDPEITEKRLAEFDIQDKRIEKILEDVDQDNVIEMLDTWTGYLEDHLEFPFEAEIDSPQEGGFLKIGNRLKVNGIKGYNDLYGVMVSVTYKGGKYSFPLFDLEVVDKNSVNYTLVDDFSVWFANR